MERSTPSRSNLAPTVNAQAAPLVRIPRCLPIWEVATEGFRRRVRGSALGVQDPGVGITGDFNSDGKLDLILPFGSGCQSGLLFVPGNGDGTFGAPVNLNPSQAFTTQNFLVGDLNNDRKLDFIWGNAVFLGNGDGTFKQIPLNTPTGTAVAIADLNGDGILDAVSGVSIYAGNGDGTFQTTPFYSPTAPSVGFPGIRRRKR